jgi:hypothetical protein
VQPRLVRRARDHRRLVRRDLREPRADLVVAEHPDVAGEVDVRLVVPRLRGEESAIELRQLLVREPLREDLHPLAAPRLDERAAEQRVEQALRLVRADDRQERRRVRTRVETSERDAAAGEHREHLLEVRELLARERGERRHQRGPVLVAEDEVDRGRGGLLLAVRVVEEDHVEVRERAVRPGGIGRCGEGEHRLECSRRRLRPAAPRIPDGVRYRRPLRGVIP